MCSPRASPSPQRKLPRATMIPKHYSLYTKLHGVISQKVKMCTGLAYGSFKWPHIKQDSVISHPTVAKVLFSKSAY